MDLLNPAIVALALFGLTAAVQVIGLDTVKRMLGMGGGEAKRQFFHTGASVLDSGHGHVPITETRDKRYLGVINGQLISRLKDAKVTDETLALLYGHLGIPLYEWYQKIGGEWVHRTNVGYIITSPEQLNGHYSVYSAIRGADLLKAVDEVRKLNTLITTREQEITLNTTDNQSWTTRTMNHAGKIRKELGQVFLPMQSKGQGQYGTGEMPFPPGATGEG